MSIATAGKSQPSTRDVEAVKAELRKRFEDQLSRATEALLLKVASLSDDKAFAALAKIKADRERSIQTRNQEAIARMKLRAYERVTSRCELLDASEASAILGISKQALSQKTKAGQLLAYTNTSNRRKGYPAFQFADNKPRSIIAKLIKDLGVDPVDTEAMNFLVQHLVSNMDFSSPGEPENVVPRYELLDNSAAVEIIKRDFINAFELGQ